MADMEPVIGNWYFDADSERSFEVINVDLDDGLVEIRYEDGDNEEYLLDAWYRLDLEPGAPSGHWAEDDDEDDEEEAHYRLAQRRDGGEFSDEELRRDPWAGRRSDLDERGQELDED